jgi:NADPH2:quinone reductase
MRAVRVTRNGPPIDVVEVQDVEVPDVEPGHVRIAVSAASINFGDIARCRGGVASVMAQPPFTLGMDVCGVVDAAGDGAEQWVGRRVVAMCAMSLGGMAEHAIAPVNGVFDAPAELDDVEAAAFTLPFHTSWLALHRRARIASGEHLLVVGGATADDVFDAVMAHTGEHGADVCVDMVGGAATEATWTCMAHEGRYVPVGFNDDPESGLTGKPLRKVSMGNFSVHGVMLSYNEAPAFLRKFGVQPNPVSLGAEVHGALCQLVSAGKVRPVIGRRIRMDEVAQALDDHENRRTSGRTVVDLSLG